MARSKNFLFLGCSLFIMMNVIAKNEDAFPVLSLGYDYNKIKIYKIVENQKHSCVVFIRDHLNNEYLVRQEKSPFLASQFTAVFEMLSCYMAAIIGVSCQQVELLPINFCFPGKLVCHRPATLHKVLPGKIIRDFENDVFGGYFSIKQNNEPDFGPMGLDENVIKCMAKHPDLPPIVAFDTFMGNRDRNRANLLYDVKKNRFYAIDTALIHDTKNGKSSVGELACKYVKYLTKQKKKIFNDREYAALKMYCDVLKKSVDLFPPHITYTFLEKFVEQSGLQDKHGFDAKFILIMKTYKERIYKAYDDVQKLIILLTKLLKDHE